MTKQAILKLGVIIILCIIVTLPLLYKNRDKIKRIYYLYFFTEAEFVQQQESGKLKYRLFSPKVKAGSKLPLILYLHPWRHGGNDNIKQISNLAYTWASKKSQTQHPCFVLAPQCPEKKEWVNKGPMKTPYQHYFQDNYPETIEMKMIVSLITKLTNTLPIDTKRIYVVGYSMGATGCWDILTRHPNIFAASIIASGVSDTSKAPVLINIPIWVFSGSIDKVAPSALNENMVNRINKIGGDVKFTLFPYKGHSIGFESFEYPGVKNWMFDQIKQHVN